MKDFLSCIFTIIGMILLAYLGEPLIFGLAFSASASPDSFIGRMFPIFAIISLLSPGIVFWIIGAKTKNEGIQFGAGLGLAVGLFIMLHGVGIYISCILLTILLVILLKKSEKSKKKK